MEKILEKSGNFVSPEKWEPCSCGKVMFSQASVILTWGVSGRHPPGQTPPRQTPSPGQTHPHGQTHTPGQTPTPADGTHPTGMHSCYVISVVE